MEVHGEQCRAHRGDRRRECRVRRAVDGAIVCAGICAEGAVGRAVGRCAMLVGNSAAAGCAIIGSGIVAGTAMWGAGRTIVGAKSARGTAPCAACEEAPGAPSSARETAPGLAVKTSGLFGARLFPFGAGDGSMRLWRGHDGLSTDSCIF